MDRQTAKIKKLQTKHSALLQFAKNVKGRPSFSSRAVKARAQAEEIANAIKALSVPPATKNCAYDVPLSFLADKVWRPRGFPLPPVIGTEVKITINSLGEGTVVGYFFDNGFAGVIIKLNPSTEPEWHTKQNEGSWAEGHALAFGAEIVPLAK